MAAKLRDIRRIPVTSLLIDLENPRYEPLASQREALQIIASDQEDKLANLAEDIAERGLNPSELPMVTPGEDGVSFSVLEGNRRIAALKLLATQGLAESLGLPTALTRKYAELRVRAKDIIPSEIECVVLPREDANMWIELKHTGENNGVGVVPWDGIQTHRFRGNSPALQAVELVRASSYLDAPTRVKLSKISITNIERLLTTPEARRLLGVDVKNRKLTLIPPEDDALARLAIVVSDVANKRVKVSDVETKDDRVAYAGEVAARPLPAPSSLAPVAGATVQSPGSAVTTGKSARRIPPRRSTLIPRQFTLTIPQARVNRIYHELQKLKLDQFPNCGAVLFRVFLELSIDDFAGQKSIPLTVPVKKPSLPSVPPVQPKEMTFREKLSTVADYLESNNLCTKAELLGVRTLVGNRYHVLSIDSLNAYVHNGNYNPVATELATTWDNVQVFVGKLWSV